MPGGDVGLKSMFKGFNAGGATIDTRLQTPVVHPGGRLSGITTLAGGELDLEVEALRVELVAEVEVEGQDSEYKTDVVFGGGDVTPPFRLGRGQRFEIPFNLPVHFEAPITRVYGNTLRGMKVGAKTRLSVAKSMDPGDLDPVDVEPLPAQAAVLEAMGRLGFQFKGADLERGHVPGQQLPFYQEIEFHPAPRFGGHANEVELTFLTTPDALTVVMEVDRRGGLLTSGGDSFIRFTVPHAAAATTNWVALLDHQIGGVARQRGWF